ncbi:MAG: hypothetical protein ABW190_05860 [Rhizobacter sp.]
MSPAEETAHAYFWVSGLVGLIVAVGFAVVMTLRDRKRRAARREERRASRRRK